MTTKPDPVVEALESAQSALDHAAPSDCWATGPSTGHIIQDLIACPGCSALSEIKDALPIARSIAEQWDELVECKEALEWLFETLEFREDNSGVVVTGRIFGDYPLLNTLPKTGVWCMRQAGIGIALALLLALTLIVGERFSNSVRMLLTVQKGERTMVLIPKDVFKVDSTKEHRSYFSSRFHMPIGKGFHSGGWEHFLNINRFLNFQSFVFNNVTYRNVSGEFRFIANAPLNFGDISRRFPQIANHHYPRFPEISRLWSFMIGLFTKESIFFAFPIHTGANNISAFGVTQKSFLSYGQNAKFVGGIPERECKNCDCDSRETNDNLIVGIEKVPYTPDPLSKKRKEMGDNFVKGLFSMFVLYFAYTRLKRWGRGKNPNDNRRKDN